MTKVELYKSRVFVTIIHLCALGQFAYGLYYSNFEVQRSYKLKTSLNRRLVPETFPQKLRFLSYWSLVSQISYILYIFINIKTYIGHTVIILIWRKCGRNRFKWALDSRSEKKRKEWKEIRLLLSPIYVCHMFVYTYVRVSVCLYSMMTVEVFYLLPAAGVNNCIRIFQIHFKFQAKHIRHSFVVTAKCCTQRERETDFYIRKERERKIVRDWVFIFSGICENLEKSLWLYWIVKSGHKSKFHPRSAPMKTKGVLAEFYWRWWMPDYLIGVNVNMPYTATPCLAAPGSDWQLIYMS